MGFFRKLAKKAKELAEDQSVSVERMPTEYKGIGSLGFLGVPQPKRDMVNPVQPQMPVTPPAPTGIEALIRPMRTDPNNQQDMQRLMDMQKQTFRSFLAPPPPQPATSFGPIDGTSLGLPMGPGTPAPAGVVMEPVELGGPMFEDQLNYAPSTKQIQDILDNLPRGVPVPGIPSIPIPDIPYQIPQITEMSQIPQVPFAVPQLPIMPSVGVSPMPAMRLARAEPNDFGAIGRGDR